MARKKLTIKRKGYTRKAFTAKRGKKRYRVRSATVKPGVYKIRDLGAPGRGKKYIPRLKKGTLKEQGYSLSKSTAARRSALVKDVRKRGYGSTRGSLWALVQLFKRTKPSYSSKAKTDFNWLVKKYGNK